MSNTNNSPALTPAAQTATGSGIAQVIGSGSATVNYYALARPKPVSAAELAQACAQLDALPLDGLPDPAPLPSGSRCSQAIPEWIRRPVRVQHQSRVCVAQLRLSIGRCALVLDMSHNLKALTIDARQATL